MELGGRISEHLFRNLSQASTKSGSTTWLNSSTDNYNMSISDTSLVFQYIGSNQEV